MGAAAALMGTQVDEVDAGGQNIASEPVGDGGQAVVGPLAETLIGRVQAGRPEGDVAVHHTGDNRALGVLEERVNGPAQPLTNNLSRTVSGPPIR